MECAVFYGKMFYVVTGFKVPEINRNHGMESDVLYTNAVSVILLSKKSVST